MKKLSLSLPRISYLSYVKTREIPKLIGALVSRVCAGGLQFWGNLIVRICGMWLTAIKAVGLWLNLMTGDAHECHQDIESV